MPIAVIVTILIWTGAIAWWAAGASQRSSARPQPLLETSDPGRNQA
jgi:hypothetical protein